MLQEKWLLPWLCALDIDTVIAKTELRVQKTPLMNIIIAFREELWGPLAGT
jgi:hypothetical protein